MKHNIMFVDDSASVLESLKWVFMDEPYYLFTFDSPLDALTVIGAIEFAVVMADHAMQRMDGFEFMKKVKKKSPDTVGMIMTGYMEFREALNAIYPGCVYRFVKKPLDNNEIRQVMESAVTHYEAKTKKLRTVGGN